MWTQHFSVQSWSKCNLSCNEPMPRSLHQSNIFRDLHRDHYIRNGSASQVSRYMHRSWIVSQFDLSFRESSILPYNLGSSAVLARNESMVRSPYQCNNSRDLERNHCGKHEQHSFGFSCPQISISYWKTYRVCSEYTYLSIRCSLKWNENCHSCWFMRLGDIVCFNAAHCNNKNTI